MMGRRSSVIATPLAVRVRRFTHTILPVIIFILSTGMVLSMWRRGAGVSVALGRVSAERVNISAATDGMLLPLPETGGGQYKAFQRVTKDQVIARLDDRPLRALLAALKADAAALQQELESTAEETLIADAERAADHDRQMTELAIAVERSRLEVVDRNARLYESQVEMSRLASQLKYMTMVAESRPFSSVDASRLEADQKSLQKLIEAHQIALKTARENLEAANARKAAMGQVAKTNVDRLLLPIRQEIIAAEARAKEVEMQLENLVVRSPVSGTISAVYYQAGQGVRAGEPIMVIAADTPTHIVAYVPANSRLQVATGTDVNIRARSSNTGFNAKVEAVASQWEPLPMELLRDQNIAQIALAVQIRIPENISASLRPGELVDVKFPIPSRP